MTDRANSDTKQNLSPDQRDESKHDSMQKEGGGNGDQGWQGKGATPQQNRDRIERERQQDQAG